MSSVSVPTAAAAAAAAAATPLRFLSRFAFALQRFQQVLNLAFAVRLAGDFTLNLGGFDFTARSHLDFGLQLFFCH